MDQQLTAPESYVVAYQTTAALFDLGLTAVFLAVVSIVRAILARKKEPAI